MIEPVCSGGDLLRSIREGRPGADALLVWWLGQSGFVVKSAAALIVIDPYLSEHLTAKYEGTTRPHVRMTRAPLRGDDLAGADLVLVSHKHSDHFDPGTVPDLFRASPEARLLLPTALLGHAREMGLPAERLVGLDAGDLFRSGETTVRAVPSAHEGLDTDASGCHLYLGFVIETGGFRLYHSGDSLAYEGLEGHLGRGPFDVLFLPINGRDPARGVAGNMNAAEAVGLASRVGARYVVPHHYDMFTFNTVPVGEFESAAEGLTGGARARVLRCGERWEVRR